MTSLWEKINIKLHSIVDRALNARSLALYDQYIRDVEAYRNQIEKSAAIMYAGIQANKRRIIRHQEIMQQMEHRVDDLLLDGDEEHARIAQQDLVVKKDLVASTEAQIFNQEVDYQRLLSGRQETRERLEIVQGERPAVENLLAIVRAGELVEQIELTLAGLSGLDDVSPAGKIASRLLSRFSEAEVRWQLAAVSLGADQASIEAERIQIDDQLAERMRRLGLDEKPPE